MARFLTKLKTEQEHNKKYFWRMTGPLVYVSDIAGPIVVPEDFEFDKNSVPPFMRWLFPVSGRRSDYAATLHDWLYVTELFDKDTCDEVYYEAMLLSGVSKWRAWSKYKAVSMFGWTVWNKHTKESIKDALQHIDVNKIVEILESCGLDGNSYLLWDLDTIPKKV